MFTRRVSEKVRVCETLRRNSLTIRELGSSLRSGKISARELTAQTFERIRAEEKFNSFITQTEEQAFATANERDRELAAGVDRGFLHGIPLAHKDNFFTRGVRTTGGSLIYRDFVPAADAVAVTKLADAGAVSVGKTNMHELAYGITSKNPHYGYVLNPHDPARIAGGSSGGSAALVAANLIPVATGSDTGGSVRIPASYCGIVGFKPTYGLLSVEGTISLAFGLDTVGVLGGCVDDCAAAFAALHLSTAAEKEVSLRGLRIGVPRSSYFQQLDREVEIAVENAIETMRRSGANVSDVELPPVAEMNTVARVIQMAETAALYHDREDPAEFGSDVWALIEQGRQIAGHEYVNAQRLRTVFRRRFDEIWGEFDLLVTPTTPITAPPIASDKISVTGVEEDVRLASTKLVRSFNLLGEPALSMPCGFDSRGLPIGLQLVAAPFQDARLLAMTSTLEQYL